MEYTEEIERKRIVDLAAKSLRVLRPQAGEQVRPQAGEQVGAAVDAGDTNLTFHLTIKEWNDVRSALESFEDDE